ncbi:hypothetical protein AAFF_G00224120 [Aldrovandia affinis]|uniref:Uncharacterized protein n=1 Tax=Aldrovandia affinis TaxID=143900 RepID=A0AAD7X2Z9_9TELE|nr:hypothetical protein AAFF_G00224120 [Aldrovandia affinis]
MQNGLEESWGRGPHSCPRPPNNLCLSGGPLRLIGRALMERAATADSSDFTVLRGVGPGYISSFLGQQHSHRYVVQMLIKALRSPLALLSGAIIPPAPAGAQDLDYRH